MLNQLIKTLHTWQHECQDKPTGLKEPAAYQRVIDECQRMIANHEIKERIMKEDKHEEMQP